jgi:hypothetical protein
MEAAKPNPFKTHDLIADGVMLAVLAGVVYGALATLGL